MEGRLKAGRLVGWKAQKRPSFLARIIHEDFVFAHNRPQARVARSAGFDAVLPHLAQD